MNVLKLLTRESQAKGGTVTVWVIFLGHRNKSLSRGVSSSRNSFIHSQFVEYLDLAFRRNSQRQDLRLSLMNKYKQSSDSPAW